MNQDDKTTLVEQEPMAQPEQARNANSSHQVSRRRLLKAAAVAPVIYTLPSGAAMANTSTCASPNGVSNGDNVRTLSTEEQNQVNAGEISEGGSLEGGYEYRPNNLYSGDAIKASCWCSLNPGDCPI